MSRHHHGQEQDQSHAQSTNRPNACPQCGAPANPFEPSVTTYRCHFCNTEYPVLHPNHDDYERRQREAEREQREMEREETVRAAEKEKKRANFFGSLVGFLVPALVVTGIVGTTLYEKFIAPTQWNGHSSFRCKSGSLTFTDIQATAYLEASETCQVTLVRPAFEASIRARDHAVINVTDGRIHSSSTAVDASGFAKIVLTGTTVDGKVSATGSSVVESRNAKILGKATADGPANLVGFPPDALPASLSSASRGSTVRPPDPGSRACTGIGACYKTYAGQVAGHLVVRVDARGDVQNVTYSGSATPDQKKCLLDLGRQKSLADAPPGPGQLVCDYAGTVTPGTQMLSQSGSFVSAPR
jgi:hypothetical protein